MFHLFNKLFNPDSVNPHSLAIFDRDLFLITYSSINHSLVFVNFDIFMNFIYKYTKRN